MSMPIPRAVVFDLDGTLVDTAPDLAAALNAALEAVDRPAQSLSTVRTLIGHGTRTMLTKALSATGGSSPSLLDAAYPVLVQHYADHICDHSRPYDGAEVALDSLVRQGIRLALCTNKPERLALALIEALGWRNRFDAVVGGDTLSVSKPNPAPLHRAITGAGGGMAVFVGDSIIDVQTAAAAGVPCIAVSFGFADRPASMLGADFVIDHFRELQSALKQAWA